MKQIHKARTVTLAASWRVARLRWLPLGLLSCLFLSTCSEDPSTSGSQNCKSLDDSNPCTVDSCDSGTGRAVHTPVTCNALDTCHIAGTCNPASGVCSNPNAPDGVSCNDNDPNTSSDTCSAGVCRGGVPVVQVVLGSVHTCALLGTGKVRCWGLGDKGTLGYGNGDTIGDNETPASAGDLAIGGGKIIGLAAGDWHTCALLEGGRLRCWGWNTHGQLGYGHTLDVGDDELPESQGDVDVGGKVKQIVAGWGHTCALLENNHVRCWGYPEQGQLGLGHTFHDPVGDDEPPSAAPEVDVGGLVKQLAAGSLHTCALLEDGRVRCWGQGIFGQLGYGNTEARGEEETPAEIGDVDLGGRATEIIAGESHTCALLENGKIRCWGRNVDGQLGYGHTNNVGDDELPASVGTIDVGSGTITKLLGAGSRNCVRINTPSATRCWGYNRQGELGYGHMNNIGDDEPAAAGGEISVGGTLVALAMGGSHACGILEAGRLRCWGANTFGQLGYAHMLNIGDDESPASAGDVKVSQ